MVKTYFLYLEIYLEQEAVVRIEEKYSVRSNQNIQPDGKTQNSVRIMKGTSSRFYLIRFGICLVTEFIQMYKEITSRNYIDTSKLLDFWSQNILL